MSNRIVSMLTLSGALAFPPAAGKPTEHHDTATGDDQAPTLDPVQGVNRPVPGDPVDW